MVFGVFLQITVLTGIGNRFDNLGTQLGLEIFELFAQLLSTANSHRSMVHSRNLGCLKIEAAAISKNGRSSRFG